MKIVYRMIERTNTEKETLPTYYGIGAYLYDNEKRTYITLKEIHDITEDKNRLLNLVQKCNKYELSLVHIHDIVEDFLYELAHKQTEIYNNSLTK